MAESNVSADPDEPSPVRPSGRPRTRLRLALSLVLLGSAYFVAGKAGLFLAVANPSVSAVWPASGIAIAALLLGGSELWPAVFAGAFLVNLTTTWDPASSAGIATGNTLEALVGTYLAIQFASGKRVLDQPRSVLLFALLSGLLASTVAASIGTTSLTLAHLSPPGAFLGVWRAWWLGDAVGIIEVTPLILAFSLRVSEPRPIVAIPGFLEGVALGVVTIAIALVVFVRAPPTSFGADSLVFLVLPPVIWAAFRFGPLGGIISVSTVSVIAIVATVTGAGPFATLPPAASLLALRIFIGSLAVTALLVAADVLRHRRLVQDLYDARKELQRMLMERTSELDAAKSLANVGNWSFDVPSGKIVWSDEMYRTFGYGDERFPVVLDRALERVKPEDRDAFLHELRSAMRTGTPPSQGFPERKYHLDLPNGEQRTVLSRLQVTGFENGRATRVTGTVQDITEREHIERELRRLRKTEDPASATRQDFPIWMIPWIAQRRK